MSIPDVIQEARERALQEAVQKAYAELLRNLNMNLTQEGAMVKYRAAVDLACLAYNLTKG